jgi:hypothetical protein
MTVRVDEPVEVSDNGVRSFIPPTFCFELHNTAGRLVDTVSQLIIEAPEHRGLRDFDALAVLDQLSLWTLGNIAEYDAGPQARVLGKRFKIERCVSQP